MKNVIKKTSVAFAALLLIGQFVSCDERSKTETPQLAEVVDVVNVENMATENVEVKKPIVFIAGYDKGSSNFYDNARSYFKNKNYKIVEGAYSIEEIITWMNKNATNKPYGNIHIVNNYNRFKGMNLETVVKGEKVTTETLRKNITQNTLPTLKNGVSKHTNIVFHSQGIGENTELMKTLKDAFVANENPNIIASNYSDVFGGEFKKHYLAESFYVFYPTANSPGRVDLSKEISKKYPQEKEIIWFDALNNEKERYVGEAYTVKYNIPITLEVDYTNSDIAMPNFTMQEEIMDFIEEDEDLAKEIEKLGIPVDKFRWKWSDKNSTLILKGKTTVLQVLKPITKPFGDLKHVEPDTNNKRLYAMK